MNDTYLHLTLTHLPIVGTLISLLILFSGWIQKNTSLIKTAFFILVALALVTIVVKHTGEEAEEFTEHMPGYSHEVIHEHEEAGELAFYAMEVTGILALITLYLYRKNSGSVRLMVALVLVANLVSFCLMVYAGKLGGEIRHTEVNSLPANGIQENEAH